MKITVVRTICLVAIVLTTAPVAAIAACQHFEFAELQSLSKDRLKLEYCLNIFEERILKSEYDLAYKLRMENLRYGNLDEGGALQRSIEAQRLADQRNTCSEEESRIFQALRKKHIDAGNLESSCDKK